MNLTPEELITSYQRLLKTIDYMNQGSTMVMVIASTWFMWIPRFVREIPYSGFIVFLIAFSILIVGFVIARRILVAPQANIRYLLYVLTIAGITYQVFLSILTIYPIIIISIAAVTKSLTDQILEQIERTQHFSSTHRVSEEVLYAIQRSYIYISERRNWLFNILLLEIVLSIIIILSFSLTDLIILLLDQVIVQYLFLGLFLVLITMLILSIFPKIDKKDEYQIYLEGNT